jgi:uncharacterized protein (DUF1800 family)
MVADPKSEALFALHRFGFGPRTGSAAAISADPRGALLADIERPGAAALTVSMPTSGEAKPAAAARLIAPVCHSEYRSVAR